MVSQTLTIALAGNPNVGKSTLFNALTGARQHVGNWPGKTVEKKEGRFSIEGREMIVVDLPGTYSLAAYSIEEIITRDFLLHEHPGAVVAVVDASNLERNLYLVTQLLELDTQVIIALNMADMARSRGMDIHVEKLSRNLSGIPVIETIGRQGIGINELKSAIARAALQQPTRNFRLDYGEVLEAEIAALQAQIEADPELGGRYNPRWLAIKLLENDETVCCAMEPHKPLLANARAAIERVTEALDEDPETLITDLRYQFIVDVVADAVTRPKQPVITRSEQVDQIITHRVWGVPIFLLLMWIVFQFTANVSTPFLDWMDAVITGPFTSWVTHILAALGMGESWLQSLLVDGVITGVGGVLVFVPVLTVLYLAIAILEDSGYMARAAFVMDRVMQTVGLHGKSFLPMLIGFGCTVPAIYATRALENERDRKLTAFLSTFMSCGARLPVYVVIGTVFFGMRAGSLIFAMYVLGIGVALLTGLVLKRTVYRNQPPQPFVMELPPYRWPSPKTVFMQMAERTMGFIRNATTVILACSAVVWVILALPANLDLSRFNQVEAEDSMFGTLSQTIAPVFAPAGFGTWQAAGSLITGFVAKEVVVGTMSQVFVRDVVIEEQAAPSTTLVEDLGGIVSGFGEAVVLTAQEIVNIIPRTLNVVPLFQVPELNLLGVAQEEEDLTALGVALQRAFSPLAAVAFSAFVLLYVPCMASVAAMRHEFGKRWTLYQIVYTLAVAWSVSVLIYQVGGLLGFGG
jgi:ferrous iron transport protein B